MDGDQQAEYYKKAGKFRMMSTSFQEVEYGFKISFHIYWLSYRRPSFPLPPGFPDITPYSETMGSYAFYFKYDSQQIEYTIDRVECGIVDCTSSVLVHNPN